MPRFNQFSADLANKVHNLSADTFKLMLTNTAPSAANAVYADVSGTELANGAGYTTGGIAVTVTSSTQTGGLENWIIAAANPTWTASASMGPFRYEILYNATPTSPLKPLIAYWDYGTGVTLSSPQTYTVSFDPTNGAIQIA
jgi:hypothetical protein